MWKVDLHAHTIFSVDCLTRPEALIATARLRGLDKIAVTEHNNLTGALAAYKLAPDLVIVGEEIKTTHGELIAYFVKEEVPRGLSPEETIQRLREQGAIISIPHPVDSLRRSALGLANVRKYVHMVDAIEVFNSRCMYAEDNERAEEIAARFGVARTAGSDAHTTWEIGAAYLEMPPFDSPETFRQSLCQARPRGHLSHFWVHFASSYAKLRKRIRPIPYAERYSDL